MDSRLEPSLGHISGVTSVGRQSPDDGGNGDEHKTPKATRRGAVTTTNPLLTLTRASISSQSPEPTPTNLKTPGTQQLAFVYPDPQTKITDTEQETPVRRKPPKPAAATAHYGYSDEELLGWVFCSGTKEAIELREYLDKQFKQVGEGLTAQITRDIPFFTEQMELNSERKEPTKEETLRKKKSLGKTRQFATSLSEVLNVNSDFQPKASTESLKSQLTTAVVGETASHEDRKYSEHLISLALATIRARLAQDCKALPKLPPRNPFEVDGFKGEYCVPVSVEFNHNGSKKLKPATRLKFLSNDGIGLCIAKQLNPESRNAASDRKSFRNDMYRSNLTIQIQLGDGTYLPVYNTATHRGQLEATGSEQFASSEGEVTGVSNEAMNEEITETVSQIAFKLAPDSEKVIISLAHQGLGNEMFMATNAALKMDISNTRAGGEGASIYVTYIDQNTVRVDVACHYDQAVTFQHSVVGKEKVDVDIVTSVLVKRQNSEDGCETLWVPVSANVKVDAATNERKIRKKLQAAGSSTSLSSTSLSSTREQIDFGKASPRSLSSAMSNLKRTTSEMGIHRVGQVTETSREVPASGFMPTLERSNSHQPQNSLRVHHDHHRQHSSPVFMNAGTHRKSGSPGFLTPLDQSQAYSGKSSTTASTTSTADFSVSSASSSRGSLREATTADSPAVSLPPVVESTDRDRLRDTSVCFEHKGQWYLSSFGSEEFASREKRVGQYEQYFKCRLDECSKPPMKSPTGVKRPEVMRLSHQLNKLSDNYPCEKFYTDAKRSTMRGTIRMTLEGTDASCVVRNTEVSDDDVRRQMSGSAFNQAEAWFAHQYRKRVQSCLNEIRAYPEAVGAKMGFPNSAANLSKDQSRALTLYLQALEESSQSLMQQASEICCIGESRPETEDEYRKFLKNLEETKARTNQETDKIRWRNRFASTHHESLLGVQAKDFKGQEKPLMTQLLANIKLDVTKDQELIQYLEIKKQELLLAKQLCTFRTLEALMESRPGNPELAEAVHYDKCVKLIHGTDGSTCEEIGVSELLNANPEEVDIDLAFEQMSLRLVEVKPQETTVPLISPPVPEPVIFEQKHLDLQASIKENLTEDLELTEEDLNYFAEIVDVDLYNCLTEDGEQVDICILTDALNLMLASSTEGYDDVNTIMNYIILKGAEKTFASLMEKTVTGSESFV